MKTIKLKNVIQANELLTSRLGYDIINQYDININTIKSVSNATKKYYSNNEKCIISNIIDNVLLQITTNGESYSDLCDKYGKNHELFINDYKINNECTIMDFTNGYIKKSTQQLLDGEWTTMRSTIQVYDKNYHNNLLSFNFNESSLSKHKDKDILKLVSYNHDYTYRTIYLVVL